MPKIGQNFLEDAKLKIKPTENELDFCVFGRGFGECIVLGIGEEYIIVDSFNNPNTHKPIALDYLDAIGISYDHIKDVIISHWHTDHIAGISTILEASQDAKVVLAPIIYEKEFNKYISLGIKQGLNSTSEFAKVLQYIKKQGSKVVKCVFNNTRIFGNTDLLNIELFSLSPQSSEIFDYISSLVLEKLGQETSYEYVDDNLLSVVLMLKYNGDGILIGGDLETSQNKNKGWDAVVNNYEFDVKSSIFKVPHHGSITGHNDGVWMNLLCDKPISILTVYNKGYKLPSNSDIKRIKNLSKDLYIVGNNNKKEDKELLHDARKAIKDIKIESISNDVGLVRYRRNLRNLSEIPEIEYFGAARLV